MTTANLRRARRLWNEGVSTSQIAARIGCGCTKDCIVGHAHRRNWPPRPSPIVRDGQRATEAVPRVGPKPHRRGGELTRMPPGEAKTRSSPREIVERVACRPLVLAVPTPRFAGCQWPFGEPKTPGFRFCGAPPVPSKPYCKAHMKIAFVSRSSLRGMEDAA